MRKIIGICGIVLLAWCAAYMQQNNVPERAWAGITCAIPIVLQNGTTADAGQVMQNFNALSLCFNNVATVNQVTCGPGLDGGTITGVGTCSLSAARRTNPTAQVFLGSSGTYTTPTNVLWLEITMCGGGGGGGGGNIVSGGATSGGTGGATTFGPLTANGGVGGTPNGAGGGPGGSASGGNIHNVAGSDGAPGGTDPTAQVTGGQGGSGPFGGEGHGGEPGSAGSAGKANSCAGGGGGASASKSAGAGGGSGGYVHHIIANPPATFSYAVGASGTAGASPDFVGGAGGSGVIIVIEHYN